MKTAIQMLTDAIFTAAQSAVPGCCSDIFNWIDVDKPTWKALFLHKNNATR